MNIVWITIAVCVTIVLVFGFLSNWFLTTETYHIDTGREDNPIRIVMLSDLHGTSFGAANRRLLEKIKKESPDMICIAGDMTRKDGKGTDSCLDLCKELVQICPVYYVPGNHEIRMESYESFVSEVKSLGINWLDDACNEEVFRGRKVNIYGLNLGEEGYHKFWKKVCVDQQVLKNHLGCADKEGTQILLAHNPEYFDAYEAWGADLVFSGHVHGGIAILPVLGGVIDPSLRLFPKYDSGLFQKKRSSMVLSRGLGTHHIRLRFFNIPEISVVNLG